MLRLLTMNNYNVKNKTITFFINGNNRTTAVIIISIVIGIAIAAVIMLFLGLKNIDSKKGIIVYSAGVLIFAVGLIFFTLLLTRKGTFAAYRAVLNPDKIEIFNKRANELIFSQPFTLEKIYIANSRIQVGYSSKKIKALCYGDSEQIFVEDIKPSPKLVVLATGNEKAVNDLKNKIMDILTK